jgi:hypothetical protein
MKDVAFLFVTCCLEPTRVEILETVIDNMRTNAPELLLSATVFDNGSTQSRTTELLLRNFAHVNVCDHNVGYWTAIDWWLKSLRDAPPEYTYIVESDMIHYDFPKLDIARQYLDSHADVGSVRLHEYSVENRHLYNKDAPVQASRKNIWQSHTNKVTGKIISLQDEGFHGIHSTNFLTQLPALNRYSAMTKCFDRLSALPKFSELDFQRFYHEEYSKIAILDGGIFHGDPGSWGSKTVTGSWSSETELRATGYQSTRFSTIVSPKEYKVTQMR